MRNTKRVAALLAAVLLSIGVLAGCVRGEETRLAATYTEGEIPAGVYVYHQLDALNRALYQVENPYGDLLSQKIEETSVADWVNAEAVEATRRFAVVEAEAKRLGLSVSPEALDTLRRDINQTWDAQKKDLESKGISYASLEAVAVNGQLLNQLFQKYYAVGGEKEVPKAEIEAYFAENFRRAHLLVLSHRDAKGELLTGEALEAQKKLAADYLARAKARETMLSLMQEEATRLFNADTEKKADAKAPELTEEDSISIVSKENTNYPQGLRDRLFASDMAGEIDLFSDENNSVVFTRLPLDPDGTLYATAESSLLAAMKGEEFTTELAAMAEDIGFVMNPAAKSFKVEKLLEK